MATDTRRLRVVVTGDSGDAQQAVEAVGASANKTGGKLDKLTGLLAKFASRGALALGVVASAGAVMGIKTAMQLEQVEMGFTSMLGSATKAKKFMTELADFAARTPFEFTELVGSAQRFLAMGFAAKDIIPMLTAVGDAVAAMGGSSESIDAVTRALGQMSAKGKVSGEELMQLTEQGIPALKILADSYGVSTMELSKMIEKGQVASDKAIPMLIKGLRDGTDSVKGFGGMMDKQADTMSGKWSTFMDNLTTGLGRFVRNFEPQIKKVMDVAGKAIGDFFAGLEGKGKLSGFSGTVNEIGLGLRAMVGAFKDGDVTSDGLVGKFEKLGVAAKVIVGVIADVTKGTIEVVGWMRKHEDAVKAVTTAIVALIAVQKLHAAVLAVQGAGGMAAYLGNLKKSFMALKAVTAVTKTATAVQWLWNIAIMSNPFGAIVLAIMAVVAVIAILWKNNDNFRKNTIQAWNQLKMVVGAVGDFFTKIVFPAIMTALGWLVDYYKGAWNLLSTVTGAVVGAISASVNWLKDAWNTSWGAIKAAAAAVAGWFMTYLWPGIKMVLDGIGFGLNLLYNVVWKPIWILIQIAMKIAVFWIRDVAWPIFKWVFDQIMVGVRFLVSGWQFWWGVIKAAAAAVAGWFTGTIVPSLQKAMDQIRMVLGWLGSKWNSIWAGIKAATAAVANWFSANILPGLKKAFDQLMAFLGWLKAGWDRQWDLMNTKIKAVTSAIAKSFKWAKDEIGREWGKLSDLAKKPVSFMINTVYNNGIRKLWNTVAEKFGIKTTLSEIKFAQGGVVPGYGPMKDRVPAVLSPGEGVAVPELIKQIGVNRFLDWNKKAREGKPVAFADGGIVGWGKNLLGKGKDIIQGIAAPVVNKLIDGLKPIVDAIPGTSAFSGLLRTGGHKLLDGFKSWVSGKDKEAGGGGNGKVMGYQKQMAILRARFPGLPLISGFRPGAMTLTGNQSYHALGRAVDVPPRKDVFEWIRSTFFKNIKELIFSPMGNRQVWNGANHLYHEPVKGQHWDHVHWAMDNGGVLPPNSTTTVTNATNKREYAMTEDKLKNIAGTHIENLNVVVQGDITDAQAQRTARKIRDELLKLQGRNGGKPALAAS